METVELTTTSDVIKSDNSENLQTQIEDKEPENKQEAVKANPDESIEVEQAQNQLGDIKKLVPQKFIDKDGNVNVKELAKSYTGIEHLVNEKAQWVKEKGKLEEQLKQYEKSEKNLSIEDLLYQQANSYVKFIDEANNPAEVEKMLNEFKNHPSEELLNKIEANFTPKTIKKAAVECEKNIQFLNKQAVEKEAVAEGIKVQEFVLNSLKKYPSYFGNPTFNALFREAVGLLGTNFNVGGFVGLIDDYANSKIYEFLTNCQKSRENLQAKTEIAQILPSNKTQKSDELPPADLLKIDDVELLKKYIRKYTKNKEN